MYVMNTTETTELLGRIKEELRREEICFYSVLARMESQTATTISPRGNTASSDGFLSRALRGTRGSRNKVEVFEEFREAAAQDYIGLGMAVAFLHLRRASNIFISPMRNAH